MKSWGIVTIVSLAAIAACLPATPARAEGVRFTNATFTESLDRISSLEAQLAELQEQETISYGGGYGDACQGGGKGDSCGKGGSCGKGACCCGGGLYFGAAMVWVKPHYKSSSDDFQTGRGVATNIEAINIQNNVNVRTVQVPFNPKYDITPRVWLGWEDCTGTGARARYWRYDASPFVFATDLVGNTFATPPLINGPGTVTLLHDTDLQALDLELTKRFEVCGCWITGSGGLRYGKLNHFSSAEGVDALGSTREVFAEGYEGLGPTFALEIGCCLYRGFGFYCGARESVLFGQDNYAYTRVDTSLMTGGPPTSVDTTIGSNDEALFISEVEVGLKWCGQCKLGEIRARVGYEGQLWHSAGGPFNDELDLGLEGASFSLALHR